MVVLASSGEVVFSNRDTSRDEAGDDAIFRPDGRPYAAAERPLARALTSGEQVVDEEFFRTAPDGSRTRLRCSAAPILDGDGNITGAISVTRDATAERRRDEQLAFLTGLADHGEDAITALDTDWNLTLWSTGAERMYGWSAAEALGRHVNEVANLALSDAERSRIQALAAERGRWRGEVIAHHKDGEAIAIQLITVALRDPEGELTGFLSIHRDLAERRSGERAVAEAERRADTILERITDAFIAVDRDWRFTYVNDRALERMRIRTGRPVTREEILGQNLWDAFPDIRGTEVDARYRQAVREQHAASFETYFPPTGEWFDIHVYPSEDGLSIYSRDISGRKRSEAETQRGELLLESISDAIYAVDRDWRIVYVNERAVEVMGENRDEPLPREELLGRTVWELFPGTVGTELEAAFRTVARDRRPDVLEFHYVPYDHWFDVHIFPTAEGLGVYFRDITRRKQAEAERERWAERQALVAELGRRALAGLPVQAVLDEAVAIAARTLDTTPIGIAEILPGGEYLRLRAGVGWKPGSVGHATSRGGRESLVGYTALAGDAVISEDLDADARFTVSPFLAGHDVTSGVSVLIAGHELPFGVLCAFSTQRRTFSSDDVNFLQGVANVISSVVVRERSDARILEVRDIERRRIARDLHDEALQDLTDALAIVATGGLAEPGSEAPERVARALKRTGEQLRGAIYDLRLHGEEDRAFRALLGDLVNLQRAICIDCEIVLDVSEGVPHGALGQTGIELLRVVREALINARRHSGARTVRVEAHGSETRLWVEVSDDGIGFDAVAEGMGIVGMRERAAVLEGELLIRSTPGQGTRVRLTTGLAGDAASPRRASACCSSRTTRPSGRRSPRCSRASPTSPSPARPRPWARRGSSWPTSTSTSTSRSSISGFPTATARISSGSCARSTRALRRLCSPPAWTARTWPARSRAARRARSTRPPGSTRSSTRCVGFRPGSPCTRRTRSLTCCASPGIAARGSARTGRPSTASPRASSRSCSRSPTGSTARRSPTGCTSRSAPSATMSPTSSPSSTSIPSSRRSCSRCATSWSRSASRLDRRFERPIGGFVPPHEPRRADGARHPGAAMPAPGRVAFVDALGQRRSAASARRVELARVESYLARLREGGGWSTDRDGR